LQAAGGCTEVSHQEVYQREYHQPLLAKRASAWAWTVGARSGGEALWPSGRGKEGAAKHVVDVAGSIVADSSRAAGNVGHATSDHNECDRSAKRKLDRGGARMGSSDFEYKYSTISWDTSWEVG